MSKDTETLRVYDAKADEYAKLVASSPDTQLTEFMEALPLGGHVLDLGCGPGNSAAMMGQMPFGKDQWAIMTERLVQRKARSRQMTHPNRADCSPA